LNFVNFGFLGRQEVKNVFKNTINLLRKNPGSFDPPASLIWMRQLRQLLPNKTVKHFQEIKVAK
jgi:hypothetical protein